MVDKKTEEEKTDGVEKIEVEEVSVESMVEEDKKEEEENREDEAGEEEKEEKDEKIEVEEVESADDSDVATLPSKELKKGKGKKIFLIILIVVFLLGLTAGGIFVYRRAMEKKRAGAVPEAEISQILPIQPEESSPSAEKLEEELLEPEIELERADLTIRVLNGSGVAGTAGKAKDFLEGLGYEEVEAGNAGAYDYEETEIAIKADKEAYLDLLKEDLSEKYSLAEEVGELDEDSEFDVEIIVGGK